MATQNAHHLNLYIFANKKLTSKQCDGRCDAMEDVEEIRCVIKNQSDALVYQTRKQLEELGDKVSADEKGQLEELINKLEEASTNENYDSMKNEKNNSVQTNVSSKELCKFCFIETTSY